MITADVNLNEFSRSINRLITRCQIEPRKVVKKEIEELTKTLVRISPPKNLTQAKLKSEKDVNKVMRPFGDYFKGQKVGTKDIRWLYAMRDLLVGVEASKYLPTNDERTAKGLVYKRNEVAATTRLGRRGKQAVTKWGKNIVRRNVYNRVINRIKNNFGRLKAGWMAAVFGGQLTLSGANVPPRWVTKHKSGVRGAFQNNLDVPGKPSFTIINRAKGVSSPYIQMLVSKAVSIRAKAMAANARLILSGKKEYQ